MKKRITVLTRDKLIKAIEGLGYKVTNQSSDGTYKLVRTPSGESTGYWLFGDRIEHRYDPGDGVSIVSYFNYSDCFALIEENSLSVIVKNIEHHGVFITLFNFNTSAPKKEDN